MLRHLSLALFAGFVLAAPVRGEDADDATKRLYEVIDRYKGLSAYEDHGVLRVISSIAGASTTDESPASIRFQRPSKLQVDLGEAKLVTDGTTMTSVITPTKSYLVAPSPRALTLASISEGTVGAYLLGAPTGQPPLAVLTLLLDLEAGARLLEGGAKVTTGSARKIGDKELPTLVLGPRQGWMMTLAIDPESALVREIALDPAPETLAGKTEVASLSMVWNAGSIATEAIDGTFAFDAPKGFKKLDELMPGESKKNEPTPLEALLGQPAPEFSLTVLDGDGKTKSVSKADLAGKVVMIDFWATWCGPCLMELPEVAKMIEAYAKDKKEVVIVALSQDRGEGKPEEVRALIEKTITAKKLALQNAPVGQVAMDPAGALGDTFHIEGLPSVVILDTKGMVQAVHVGYSDDVRDKLTRDIDTLLGGEALVKPEAEKK